jgi:hypothetical protein
MDLLQQSVLREADGHGLSMRRNARHRGEAGYSEEAEMPFLGTLPHGPFLLHCSSRLLTAPRSRQPP